MILVDMFSSFLFVEPLANLRSATVAKALLKTVQTAHRCCATLLTDFGVEWIGADMQTTLKKLRIAHECKSITMNKQSMAESSVNVVKKFVFSSACVSR